MKAQRLLHHPKLSSRVIKKKKHLLNCHELPQERLRQVAVPECQVEVRRERRPPWCRVQGVRFGVQG